MGIGGGPSSATAETLVARNRRTSFRYTFCSKGYLRRFFVSAMLRSPDGFGGGIGSCRGAGGCGASVARMPRIILIRGDSGKRLD
jgi:hypothetical protein